MKVSGFSIIRNGVEFDYPFLESYRSILPLVDELILNVGEGTDDTLEILEKFATEEGEGKIRIFQSEWPLNDPEKKKGGAILSEQTNLALGRCSGDWCFYIQADEVVHEEDYSALRTSMEKHLNDPAVQGLLFDYVHFYGSYDVIQVSRSAYRREVRIVKNHLSIVSVGDAQSFRFQDGSKLEVAKANARIFHYGWVRDPNAMKEKTFFMDQLYHGNPTASDAAEHRPHTGDNYRYKKILGLERFGDTHPQTMRDRIQKKNWNWDLSRSPLVWSTKDIKKILLNAFERLTGIRLFEYKSYRLVK